MTEFDDGARAEEAEVRERIGRYVDGLRTAGAIRSPRVERAFRTVQRHRLLETFYYLGAEGQVTVRHDPWHPRRDHLGLIYADTALATRYIGGFPAHPLVLVRKEDGALRGRVVLFTGFMPVRGPLHIEDLWARAMVMADPEDVVHEPAAEPLFGQPRTGDPDFRCEDESDFLFFLGLADRRACSSPWGSGLSNDLDGWATVARDGIRWWKDAALAGELDRRYRDWDARGRPAVGDYQVSFLPIGTECDAPPGGWQIERRFYRELVTLSPAQSRP